MLLRCFVIIIFPPNPPSSLLIDKSSTMASEAFSAKLSDFLVGMMAGDNATLYVVQGLVKCMEASTNLEAKLEEIESVSATAKEEAAKQSGELNVEIVNLKADIDQLNAAVRDKEGQLAKLEEIKSKFATVEEENAWKDDMIATLKEDLAKEEDFRAALNAELAKVQRAFTIEKAKNRDLQKRCALEALEDSYGNDENQPENSSSARKKPKGGRN